MRLLAIAVLSLGCHRSASVEVRPDPAPSVVAKPKPEPAPVPVHRVRGDIEGYFATKTGPFLVGEPIVVVFHFTPRSAPMRVFVGGDQRNVANYPMRFAVRARDASGAVVCDLVDKPALMSFGGIGGEQVVPKGEPYHERFVLNPACPALATPGTYRLTLHRRITDLSMVYSPPGKKVPLSCDVVPVHEQLPSGLEPACVKMLDAAPSITSELLVEVRAFDDKALRVALDERLREIALAKDAILHHRVERWMCGFVSCTCPKVVTDADLLAAIPAKLPSSFPSVCP